LKKVPISIFGAIAGYPGWPLGVGNVLCSERRQT
jgi:hypothetical protein